MPSPVVDDDDDDDPTEWEERSESMPFWRHAFAGSVAGITEHCGMFPLDTVKTRMQASCLSSNPSMMKTIRAVIAERGFLGLWRGATVIGIGCVPAHCGLFITYEMGKQQLVKTDKQHQPLLVASCGAAAQTVHDVVLTPTDVVKQRLQLGCYKGPMHCVRDMIHAEGIGALFRSLPVTLITNGPHTAVLAVVNESMKTSLGLDRGRPSDLPWYFLCAGVGGAVASSVTLPLDVLKTRIQTQGVRREIDGDQFSPKRQGAFGVARSIFQKDGVRGFYRGLVPVMIVKTPGAAMCWGTYEMVQSLLCNFCGDGSVNQGTSVGTGQDAIGKEGGVASAAFGKALEVAGRIVVKISLDRPKFLLHRLELINRDL